jgi:hypothetical protein
MLSPENTVFRKFSASGPANSTLTQRGWVYIAQTTEALCTPLSQMNSVLLTVIHIVRPWPEFQQGLAQFPVHC